MVFFCGFKVSIARLFWKDFKRCLNGIRGEDVILSWLDDYFFVFCFNRFYYCWMEAFPYEVGVMMFLVRFCRHVGYYHLGCCFWAGFFSFFPLLSWEVA